MNELLEQLKPIFSGEVFLLTLVMGSFLLGVFLYKRTQITLLQPLLITMLIIIPFLKITGIEYHTFYEKTNILNFMLGPSVVALGYVLYEQIENVKEMLSLYSLLFL